MLGRSPKSLTEARVIELIRKFVKSFVKKTLSSNLANVLQVTDPITIINPGASNASIGALYDDTTIGINGSGELEVKDGGIGSDQIGSVELDDLSDVVITTPSDGDVLTYDNGSGDWINLPPTGFSLPVGVDGQALIYDAAEPDDIKWGSEIKGADGDPPDPASLSGGDATNTNVAGGTATLRGGVPDGTGNSVVEIYAQDNTGVPTNAITVSLDGIGFFDNAPTARPVVTNISNLVSGLAVLGLITGSAGNPFQLLAIQVFTTSGADTYTPTSGMEYCLVISTGGGGGGGGADTAGGSGDIGVGGGGGAGGTVWELFTSADIGASQTLNIGALGGGGGAGLSGSAGGNTTFGALHTAAGGNGGTGSGVAATDASATAGAAGGAGSGGHVNIAGGDGGYGVGMAVDGTTDGSFGLGGMGGGSFWGTGGRQVAAARADLTTDINTAGTSASARGSGGSGAVCLNSTTGAAGGDGAPGIIVVLEFLVG